MFHFQKQGGELRPFHFATNRYPTEKPRQSRGISNSIKDMNYTPFLNFLLHQRTIGEQTHTEE